MNYCLDGESGDDARCADQTFVAEIAAVWRATRVHDAWAWGCCDTGDIHRTCASLRPPSDNSRIWKREALFLRDAGSLYGWVDYNDGGDACVWKSATGIVVPEVSGGDAK